MNKEIIEIGVAGVLVILAGTAWVLALAIVGRSLLIRLWEVM